VCPPGSFKVLRDRQSDQSDPWQFTQELDFLAKNYLNYFT
jgi:hypothetical protein